MSVVSVTVLLLHLPQSGWAATIHCPSTPTECNGTSGDDIIFGDANGNVIHGLAGNDYIIGRGDNSNYLWGDDGDDILIGSRGNDGLYGMKGNDRYDGLGGDDSIIEHWYIEAPLVSNDDIISGGGGDDYIAGGEGVDRTHGGPGDDWIHPGTPSRDFSYDYIDCGSGTGDQARIMYLGDGDTALNCEYVSDNDQ